MANPTKRRGDEAEREALALVVATAPGLTVDQPMRQLGAGRRDDIGDLRVFEDCVVQVKASRPSTLAAALRQAAIGAMVQASNLGVPLGVGLTRLHNQRENKWIATTTSWPVPLSAADVTAYGSPARAVERVRGTQLVALVSRANSQPYLLASWGTWLAAYRGYRREGGWEVAV